MEGFPVFLPFPGASTFFVDESTDDTLKKQSSLP